MSSGDIDLVLDTGLGDPVSLIILTGGDSDTDLGTDLRILSIVNGSVDFGLVSL